MQYVRNPSHNFDKTKLCEVSYIKHFLDDIACDIEDYYILQSIKDFKRQLDNETCILSYAYSTKESFADIPDTLMVLSHAENLSH